MIKKSCTVHFKMGIFPVVNCILMNILSTTQSFDTGVKVTYTIKLKIITILDIEKCIISKYAKIKNNFKVHIVQLNGMQCR